MKLDCGYGQVANGIDAGTHVGKRLARQAQNQVHTTRNATLGDALNGIARSCPIMTTINQLQGVVVHRFNAKLYHHKGAARQLLQLDEQFIAQAIGTGGNDNAHHIIASKSLTIKSEFGEFDY